MWNKKAQWGKRMLAVLAAVSMTVTVALGYPGMPQTQPIKTYAKESFGGIKQIVREHGEDEPYVILDIVPGKGTYTHNGKDYDFSIGTLGYLVSGQAPIEKDLENIFVGNQEDFYEYDDRADLADAVVPDFADDSFIKAVYEEAYEGTGVDVSRNGWIKILDPVADVDAANGVVPKGRMYATWQEWQEGESTIGYDYNLADGSPRPAGTLTTEDTIYQPDKDGIYQVTFENPQENISGYQVTDVNEDWKNSTDATSVYRLVDGKYYYAGTVKELKRSLGIYSEEDEEEPKKEDKKPATEEKPKEEQEEKPGSDTKEEDVETGDGDDTDQSDNDDDTDIDDTDNDDNKDTDESGDANTEDAEHSDSDSDVNDSTDNELTVSAASSTNYTTGAAWYRLVETGGDGAGSDSSGSGDGSGDSSGSGDGSGDSSGSGDGSGDSSGSGDGSGDNSGSGDGSGDNSGSGDGSGDNGGSGDGSGDNSGSGDGSGDNSGSGDGSGDNSGSGDESGDNSGSGDGSGDNSGSGDESGDNGGNDDDQDGKESDGSIYCIVTFSYVEDLEEAQELYQVKDVTEYTVEDGEAAPEDTYSDNGSKEDEETELTTYSTESVGVEYAFVYVGPGQGTYKLTRVQKTIEKDPDKADKEDKEDEKEEEKEEDGKEDNENDGTEVTGRAVSQDDVDKAAYVEVQNVTVYMRCCKGNDWLERYVFNSLDDQDNSFDEFGVEVRCVPAEEVDDEMVNEADLFFLEDGLSPFLNTGVQINYSGVVDSRVIAGTAYGVVADLKPVIVDYGIIDDDVNYVDDDTYQKLARIFLKKDLSSFYYEMDQSGSLAENLLMNVEKDSEDHPNKKDNDYNYVNRNVYIINNEKLVSEDFADSFDDDKVDAGFEEVLAAIKAENMTLSEDDRIDEEVSKAMAMQYIINFSVGLIGDYKDLSILELQPTANAVSDLHRDVNEDRGSVVLYWQREDMDRAGQQILRSSKKIETNVTVKSVVEFNGEYQDINSQYDMIFIGLDGQNLYRERNKDGKLIVKYNDEDLNGKVYHTGDRVANGDGRYDANDITVQKREALLDYLRAGYPIVVENDCFKGKSAKDARVKDINTDYIASDTQMYEFLKQAIEWNDSEDHGERIGIYTIEDVHSSAMFMAQLNTVRPLIELQTAEGGEDASDVIATEQTPEGQYKGEITYRISSDRAGEDKSYGGELEKHLYLDMNYDGIFMPDEEIYEYLDEDMDGVGRISVDFQEVCFGIVPWKLEVSDAGNSYRRDSIQGYFTIHGEGDAVVHVLQVLDDPGLTAANMQVQYEEMTNSMLKYYLQGAETLLDMQFEIETVTPAELAVRLDKNGAYLSGWDVLVLGFGNSGHPGDTVVEAVNNYLSSGGSVVVSSAAAEADKGGLGISAQYLGQSDRNTYGALGMHSGEKYRYKGLSSVMFNKLPGLYVENINEGTISKWPYQVGTIASLGENTEIKAPEYLLDIDAGYAEPVTHATAWYTLNESGPDTNAYNVSPRDARNNYYIYSKGNVVYVGQSEYPYIYDPTSGVAPDAGEKGAGETMLFVNALLSAYNSGVHVSSVSIVAGFTGASQIESITIPFDVEFKNMGEAEGGILDETVDVYFKFTDNNIAFDKVTEVTFYYENGNNPEASLILPDRGINTADFTNFTSPIWMVEDNHLVEVAGELKQGNVYRIKAPVVVLQTGEAQTADIYVLLRTSYTRSGQSREMLSQDSIALTRAQMFLLE